MITSLCATGMPVSADAFPAAMRASAALAWASAPSRSTVRNAFSDPFAASMRPRSPRVSSTLERRRASKARESSATEAVITKGDEPKLTEDRRNEREPLGRAARTYSRARAEVTPLSASFDDLRYQIQPALDSGCVALVKRPLVAFGRTVLAQRQNGIVRMRHRYDAGRIDGAHTLDHLENALELVSHVDGLGHGDLDPCQVRSALNVIDGKSHDQKENGSETRLNRVS